MKANKTAAVLIPESPVPVVTPRAAGKGVVLKLISEGDRTVPGKDQAYLERMGRWHARRHRRKHHLGYLRR